MTYALKHLVSFVLQIATFIFVARFLLQACRVDFYNPVSQGLVKVADPVLRPMRMVLPGYRNLDIAAVVAAVLAQMVLIMWLQGGYVGNLVTMIAAAVLPVLMLIIGIFWWSILIVIIAGWIAPGSSHSALRLLHQITEPLLAPARRLLPSMGRLDFSAILVFLLLGLLGRNLPRSFLYVIFRLYEAPAQGS